jgi:hypothetical protein
MSGHYCLVDDIIRYLSMIINHDFDDSDDDIVQNSRKTNGKQ